MAVSVIVVFVLLSSLLTVASFTSNLPHITTKALDEANAFIDSVIEPKNCSGLEFVSIYMGIGGGFAAQFQLAASEWMRAFAAVNYSKPVIMRGRLIGYSDAPQCKPYNNEWTCYFHPMSSCQEELIRTGKSIDAPGFGGPDEMAAPAQFRSLGYAFWWGVVQHRMFRPNEVVEQHILDEAHHMDHGHGFPFGFPISGMHVRHGDKHTDGFKDHSFGEELQAASKSPECTLRNQRGDCFYVLNFSNPHSAVLIQKAFKRHTAFLRKETVDCYNATVAHLGGGYTGPECEVVINNETHYLSDDHLYVNPRMVWHHYNGYMQHHHGFHHGHNGGGHNMNSSNAISRSSSSSGGSGSAGTIGNEVVQGRQQLEERDRVLGGTIIVPSAPVVVPPIPHPSTVHEAEFVLPLRVFVASDDLSVLRGATRLGHMADTTGISQDAATANAGMLKTLVSHPELAYNATLEIITDIYFLSHSSSLLGICASQVFRTAVALSNVTGVLKYAVVMDGDQVNKVKGLSTKYGIPFPEQFDYARR